MQIYSTVQELPGKTSINILRTADFVPGGAVKPEWKEEEM